MYPLHGTASIPSRQSRRPSLSREAHPPGWSSSPTMREWGGVRSLSTTSTLLPDLARETERADPRTPAPTRMTSYDLDGSVASLGEMVGMLWLEVVAVWGRLPGAGCTVGVEFTALIPAPLGAGVCWLRREVS